MRSITVDIGGPVHLADFGGDGPPMLLLHGLGASHTNWSSVADDLTRYGHVLAPDLVGFGYTPLDGRTADVRTNSRLVVDLVRHIGEGPAVLVGNSMGALLALLAASQAPAAVRGLVLLDAALPIIRPRFDRRLLPSLVVPLLPGIGPRLLRRRLERLGAEGSLDETLRFIMVDPGRLSAESRAVGIEMAEARLAMPWGAAAFSQASRSLAPALARRRRFKRMVSTIDRPGLIVHGAKDRLVDLASAQWLARTRPDWRLQVFADVGHVPQLEVPGRVVDVMADWLAASQLVRSG